MDKLRKIKTTISILKELTDFGCFYSQFRTPTDIQKYCSCMKFRPAKAKEK